MPSSTLEALRRVSARSLTLLLSRGEFAALELAQARVMGAAMGGFMAAAAIEPSSGR